MRHLRLIFAIAVVASLGGCLTGLQSVIAVYDAKLDQFRYLVVFQNINDDTKDPGASDYLAALYSNRDHLIPSPITAFGTFLRISDSECAEPSLLRPSPKGLDKWVCSIPLNAIRIVPGKFFVRDGDCLCYYHEVILPGSTVDQLLALASSHLCHTGESGILTVIDEELKRRATGGVVPSWDEFERALVRSAADPETTDQTYLPLSSQSLTVLREHLSGGSIRLDRSGSLVSVSIPLSKDDVKNLLHYANRIQTRVRVAVDRRPTDWEETFQSHLLRGFANALSLERVDDTHVRFNFDLIQQINGFPDPRDALPDATTNPSNVQHALTEETRRRFALASNISVDQLVADFKVDRLAPSMPQPSLPPGTGLGLVRPSTSP